jgi:hypothetical protein
MVAKPDDTPTARLKITVDPHSFDFEGLEEIVWLPVGGATDGA